MRGSGGSGGAGSDARRTDTGVRRADINVRRADVSLAAIAALLVLIAGWAAWATRRAAREVPGDAAWRQAAALVRSEFRQGDLIVFAPAWVEPTGRLHLGDLMPLEDLGRMDAARFARVWVLAIRGAGAAEVAGETPELAREVAGISVRRYRRQPAIVLDEAVRALATARVTGAAERGPAVVLGEVDFRPHRCVQVVPVAGQAVTITFPRFALGSQLVGYVGLADAFTRRDIRQPGQLELAIGGRPLVKRQVGIEDGWIRFQVATAPGPAEVTVTASAPSPRARDRLICFALESRR